jgi:hypothetical protein
MAGLYNLLQMFPSRHEVLTPADNANLDRLCLVYVRTAGSVAIEDRSGEVVVYALEAGQFAPVVARRVLDTGTTVAAGDVIGLWR